MENASKALIIAGAILLAILLISLGILIFNQAQDTVNNGGMSQAEITAFNNKFLKYEGTQSATVVKSMMNEVLQTNSKVEVKRADNTGNPTGDALDNTSWIENNASYTVKIYGYNTDGTVHTIVVK